MEELLQKLLEAEVLSEETKKELEEAFQAQKEEAIEQAKQEATADVRAELTEQWVAERDALIEAVDSKVDDFLATEMEELKEDIERFRDLEAEYAEKLVEAKGEMSNELKGDLGQLVEKIDAFLEMRINAEFEELKEDIDEVRKNDFGRRIFESFVKEYSDNYADEETAEATLKETQSRLDDTYSELEEALTKIAKMEREQKLDEVLSPLSGRQKEVMEAILKNVETEQLEEGYSTFIGRVIRETDEASEKEGKVLAERAENDMSEIDIIDGIIREGNSEEQSDVIVEGLEAEQEKARRIANLKKLAGL